MSLQQGVLIAAKALMKMKKYHQSLKFVYLGLSTLQENALSNDLYDEYLATVIECIKLLIEDNVGGKADRKKIEKQKYLSIFKQVHENLRFNEKNE